MSRDLTKKELESVGGDLKVWVELFSLTSTRKTND